MFLVAAVVLLFVCAGCRGVQLAVPYREQITDFGCGDASVQMVLAYYNMSVSQSLVANVMRTSVDEGTLSLDISRAGTFSSLSVPQGSCYSLPLQLGWGHKSGLGMIGSWNDETTMWLKGLYELLEAGVPPVLLMHYDPFDIEADDGHFRVLTGLDLEKGIVVLNDPWGRGTPKTTVWNVTTLQTAWNYLEKLSPRKNPYFAAVMYPLVVSGNFSSNMLLGQISYPCYSSMKANAPVVRNIAAQVNIRQALLSANATEYVVPQIILSSSSVAKSNKPLSCGESQTFQFSLSHTKAYSESSLYVAEIVIFGLIEGLAVASPWNSTVWQPQYAYTDIVGNSVSVEFEM